MSTPFYGDPSNPRHAGNTGRHEDSTLWDRLRADLSNFGAAYGPITNGLAEAEKALARQSADTRTADEIVVDMVSFITDCRLGETQLTEPDLNLYYDGIILAARKKREALAWMDEPLTDDERDICHQMWDEQERAEKVSRAMDRPLSFPKRIGWKPGGGGE